MSSEDALRSYVEWIHDSDLQNTPAIEKTKSSFDWYALPVIFYKNFLLKARELMCGWAIHTHSEPVTRVEKGIYFTTNSGFKPHLCSFIGKVA